MERLHFPELLPLFQIYMFKILSCMCAIMPTFVASSSSSASGVVPSPCGEPSPMESFLDSDLILLTLIGILGFKECVRKLCMLNKKNYKTVLNVFLVHTKQKVLYLLSQMVS